MDRPISHCVLGRDQFNIERTNTLNDSTDTRKEATLRNERPSLYALARNYL